MSATTGPATIRFSAPVCTIENRAIVRLPAKASAQLPSRGQVAVTGTLNAHRFATVLEPDGARGHWLSLDSRLQKIAAVTEGDVVAVDVQPTKEWPEPKVPTDLAKALAAAPQAIRAMWQDITPMARWEWVRWVNATKNPQTRQRRVEVTIAKMKSGKRRPCCFDLSACTDPDLARSGKLIGIR